MATPPCRKNGVDCTKRKVGCQTECPEMKAFYQNVAKERKARESDRLFKLYFIQSCTRLKRCDPPDPRVNLKNKQKRRERSGQYDAKIEKIVKPGSTGHSG